MFLKSKTNEFYEALERRGLHPTDFIETKGDDWYRLDLNSDDNFYFEVKQN